MSERILIKDLTNHKGQEASISGWVNVRRDQGKLVFMDMRDMSGLVQCVVLPKHAEAMEMIKDVRTEWVLKVTGMVNARPEKNVKAGAINGDIELEVTKIEVLNQAETPPFDLSKSELNLQLNTLLDNRPLSLRHPSVQAIFKLYDLFLKGYESVMREEGFTEIKTPKLLETSSEGGANVFKIKYFDRDAYLAQSPQFYKQIMVGVFERVFEIGSTFRAEPHFTTRHVNEYISLDAEMGFINDFDEVMAMLNRVIKRIFAMMAVEGKEYLSYYNASIPEVLETIPRVKLAEIKKIIKTEYNHEIPEDTDIDPEGERLACRYAKEKFNSDFIFITHYPWKYRPFYTMPDKNNPEETYGFDLLFNGMEIVSGGQRIHNYSELIENMNKKGVKPKGMEFYLDVFKFGIPPHGGWGLGSERVIQQILGLKSIKEALLFPRDVNRLSP